MSWEGIVALVLGAIATVLAAKVKQINDAMSDGKLTKKEMREIIANWNLIEIFKGVYKT